MKDRLLTLDNLYQYYSEHKRSFHFSAKEKGKPIVVQVPANLKFDKEKVTTGLTAVTLQACHTDKNLNGSSISKEVMEEKFLPTFKNRPILGYIHEVDGQFEFYGHNMHIDEDNEIVYDESPIGIIPETNNAKLSFDEKEDNYKVIVDGYIFNDYSKAKEIIEREGECAVSVELSLEEFSYNAKEKTLEIEDGYFSGVTILGKDDNGKDVLPGMKGSNIKLKDFSAENNSNFSEDKLIEAIDRLNETISNFNINSVEEQMKGGSEVNKFEQLLEQYGKTVEDITFDYEGLSDEELETAFKEAFTETVEEPEVVETESVEETETVEEIATEYSVKHTVECNGITKEFSISLNDKIYALQELINDTYADDCDWYSVEVFEDSKTVQFYGWFKAYRQNYKVKGDNYSLVGDRVEIHSVWMTDDEEKKFEELKANYSSTVDKLSDAEAKLAKYEEEPEKIQILESEEYAKIADTEEFAELKKRDTYFDLSIDEIKNRADSILLDYAKHGKLDFSVKEEPKEKKSMFIPFMKAEEKSSFLDDLLKQCD